MKVGDAETDGRHLSLLYPSAYIGEKKKCTYTSSDLICLSSTLNCADCVNSRTWKLLARRCDTVVLCGFNNW